MRDDDPGPELCWCTGKPRYLYDCAVCVAERAAEQQADREREYQARQRHRAIMFGSEE